MPNCALSATLSCFILSWNLCACHWWITFMDHSPSQSATHQNPGVLHICGLRKVLGATFLSSLRIPHLFRGKHTWVLQTLPVFLCSHLKELATWWFNLCGNTEVGKKEALWCNVSSTFKMCPCACSTCKLYYTCQLWIMLKPKHPCDFKMGKLKFREDGESQKCPAQGW